VPRPLPVSRRTALGAVVAAGLSAGCTGPASEESGDARTGAPEDPDVALVSEALATERHLLDRVVATVRRHPDLATALAGARATHRAHVRLLRAGVPASTPTASPSASGSPSTTATAAPVPRTAPSALLDLAAAEEHLGRSVGQDALAARSGAFARVLASMAAAAAQQAVHLRAAAREHR
jgi:hypothetical protein